MTDLPAPPKAQASLEPHNDDKTINALKDSPKNRWGSILAGAVGGAAVVIALSTVSAFTGKIPLFNSDNNIRHYILEHPEIIPQAMEALQQKEINKLVTENKTALETPFGSAWLGAEKGDVTIVEFSDYGCGYCRKAVSDLNKLLAEDKNVRLVIRQLPILGPDSEMAARTALAIAQTGSHFGAFHNKLYSNGPLSREAVMEAVHALGLNATEIEKESNNASITQEITHNIMLAREFGLSGTPAFIIGNKVFSGVIDYDSLKEAVNKARTLSKN
ncbi:MAG: DsbA family protein [Zymomonas mobilis subsp. pomaceae]|uniref:DSBA oxidoreductase n=1 Tax=Zymomonas mobilis subsp. pomaceae (strain ATCC 29192 / DSM 22645 / JCM 10191 / CCUG 17912 / NBRC 13757 / NCIMB 11200 / NRRL B-4491 / Barker I) TaxID=579138 RepID=F8ESX3_ZYMMT|nr:DsbA family protein [Zymomonas mobilis]AEI37877.1 DSBA oxidoreductase [Zymomonas mobilis subsp. pomaceae ATCC 29192]MDX5949243.1 DsbA family protein [Zymomonas mobilis subsp. pomaceae]GEB89527.1 membrane protein [Zymomonas mobilis subsp. pomaceae]